MEKYNIHDFIKHTKENKDKYICYCEALIDPHGSIILARPSHTEAAISYAVLVEGKERKDVYTDIPFPCLPLEWIVDKYGLVAIWYNEYMYGTYRRKKPNRFQRRSLDILMQHGLIRKDGYVRQTSEYDKYLIRKSMGINN